MFLQIYKNLNFFYKFLLSKPKFTRVMTQGISSGKNNLKNLYTRTRFYIYIYVVNVDIMRRKMG